VRFNHWAELCLQQLYLICNSYNNSTISVHSVKEAVF